MAGSTISPLAISMAMEVIRASSSVVGGQRIRPHHSPQPRLALLRNLQEFIELAQMKIKPSKSRSISIFKGKLSDQHFYIGNETILTVSEKPVKSQGRWCNASFEETEQVDQPRKDVVI